MTEQQRATEQELNQECCELYGEYCYPCQPQEPAEPRDERR